MSAKVLKRKHFQIEDGFSQSKQMEKQRSPRIQIEAYNEAKIVNLFTQNNREATAKANLLKCQHQEEEEEEEKKKKKKKKSVSPNQIRKGKRVVKQMDVDQRATGIYFQEQIIVEILSRLPVQSVLRFKCVSKIWEALISNPCFKMKNQSPDSNSQRLLIREVCYTQDRLLKFYFYSSSLSTFEDVQELDPPSSYNVDHYEIFCSFDGLVLLGADAQLLLWNPSTRESAILPHSKFSIKDTSFGLGYDAKGDGYKILKLNIWECDQPQSIEILTLKSGSWRKICNYPADVCSRTGNKMEICPYPSKIVPMDPLVYVHGSFHWLGELKVGGKFYVVSFCISNEVYGDVPLLEEMCIRISCPPDIGLSLLEGMLCFHTTTYYHPWCSFKLWAMKDYGVKESWFVLFTIQLSGFVTAKPQYRFSNGDVLLYARGELPYHSTGIRSFVFQTSKGKFGFWPRRGSFEKGIVYTESFISPKSVNSISA